MKRALLAIGAVLTLVICGGILFGIITEDDEPDILACAGPQGGGALSVSPDTLPAIDGYSTEQVSNAATILTAARDEGLDAHGQQVVLMTALAESSLINVDHGDAVRNDTIGLFQTGPEWGPYEDRMDPYQATRLFIERLRAVDGWENLPPTLAAHKAQRNAAWNHYTRSWTPAGFIMAELGGYTATPGQSCAGPGTSSISAAGFAHPLPGLNKWQNNYAVWRGTYFHAGEDLSAPAGTPIYAIGPGVVVRASCQAFAGRSPCNIIIDHGADEQGNPVQSWYVHMYPGGMHVRVGDAVQAGQHIADVGSNGNSTGPHLHLEVHVDGKDVDPTAWLAARGIDITARPTTPNVTAAAGTALAWSRTVLGTPYELGAAGPDSYDCSGLTQSAYRSGGMTLPRTSREQYTATTRITREDLQPGDLIFWSRDGTAAGIYHVAIYAGLNGQGQAQIVQAPAPGRTVEEVQLWTTNIYGYGRVTG